MTTPIPAVFVPQPAGSSINLGDVLRAYEAGLRQTLPGGTGGMTTLMAPSDNPSRPGGLATLAYPHD
jgi:hypothetical protein